MIKITGWTNIYHSYAMVNQWQMLALDDLNTKIAFHEAPKYRETWTPEATPSGFPVELKRQLERIKQTTHNEEIKAEYRITYPYDISRSLNKKVFIFGTSEYRIYPQEGNVSKDKFINFINNNDVEFITPSNWSKKGFVRSGIYEEKIHVLSHGVWKSIFKPTTNKNKLNLRSKLGLREEDFVILNIGAMTHNKGVDILLIAAWHLRDSIPNIRLVFKDASSLYNLSLKNVVSGFNQQSREILVRDLNDKIINISGNLNIEKMADLYNLADVYVSPYRAEGFNLPPLEASSCGTPVIITDGGASDDYYNDIIGYKVESKKVNLKNGGVALEPNLDSLIEKIKLAYSKKQQFDYSLISQYAHANFNWHNIAKKLKDILGD